VLVQKTLDFGGKVSKLVSLSASYASVQFYKYLIREKYDLPREQQLLDFIEHKPPHFDSRVFELPSNAEIVNNLIWRARIDFRRNSIATLAQAHFNQKQLNGVNTKQMLKMLTDLNDRWEDKPLWYRVGVYAKKERYLKEVEVKGEIVSASRTRIVSRNVELTREYTLEQETWILAKFWPSTCNSYPFDPATEKSTA